MTENINKAYQEIELHGSEVSNDALNEMKNALKHAEDFFTYRQAETEDEASAENDALKAAIEQFMNAVADGIDVNIANDYREMPVEYYNLNGQRITSPQRGVMIVRQGNVTKKIYVK